MNPGVGDNAAGASISTRRCSYFFVLLYNHHNTAENEKMPYNVSP